MADVVRLAAKTSEDDVIELDRRPSQNIDKGGVSKNIPSVQFIEKGSVPKNFLSIDKGGVSKNIPSVQFIDKVAPKNIQSVDKGAIPKSQTIHCNDKGAIPKSQSIDKPKNIPSLDKNKANVKIPDFKNSDSEKPIDSFKKPAIPKPKPINQEPDKTTIPYIIQDKNRNVLIYSTLRDLRILNAFKIGNTLKIVISKFPSSDVLFAIYPNGVHVTITIGGHRELLTFCGIPYDEIDDFVAERNIDVFVKCKGCIGSGSVSCFPEDSGVDFATHIIWTVSVFDDRLI